MELQLVNKKKFENDNLVNREGDELAIVFGILQVTRTGRFQYRCCGAFSNTDLPEQSVSIMKPKVFDKRARILAKSKPIALCGQTQLGSRKASVFVNTV